MFQNEGFVPFISEYLYHSKKNLDFNDLKCARIKDLGGSSQNTFNLIDFDDLKSTSMKDLGSFAMVEKDFWILMF